MKEARRWDGVVSREEAAVLDHSEMSASNGVNGGQAGGEFKPDVSNTVPFSAQSVVKSLEIKQYPSKILICVVIPQRNVSPDNM